MNIFQQRSNCLTELHELLLREVNNECALHDKTYPVPFRKKLERVIKDFMTEKEMNKLFDKSDMPVTVKVMKSVKAEGSYFIYVSIGEGIFYEKIVHDGATHETFTETFSSKSDDNDSGPIPIPTVNNE